MLETKEMKTLPIAIGVCCLVLFAASSRAISGEDATAYDALLDRTISEQIATRNNSLRKIENIMTEAGDMTQEGSDRVAAFKGTVKAEIVYLTELKTHGQVSIKQAFCIMVFDQELSRLSFQLMYKRAFDAPSEPLPKTKGRLMTDAEIESMESRVKELTELKKKIEGITRHRTE